MNYQLVVKRLIGMHLNIWGAFNDSFPPIESLIETESSELLLAGPEKILFTHALEVRGYFDEISVFEVSRLKQEYDTIRLMLLVLLWGMYIDQDVPITEEDLSEVNGSMSDLCVAGWEEPGQNIQTVLRRLIDVGLQMKALPEPFLPLFCLPTSTG